MRLERFLEAQEGLYQRALQEIKDGKKQSHWMWFIFPQLKGLGSSPTSSYYGIADITEAIEYLAHPVLGKRLIEICSVLLKFEKLNAQEIFGYPDTLKFRSSLTLFSTAAGRSSIFGDLLQKYFDGNHDSLTLQFLNQSHP